MEASGDGVLPLRIWDHFPGGRPRLHEALHGLRSWYRFLLYRLADVAPGLLRHDDPSVLLARTSGVLVQNAARLRVARMCEHIQRRVHIGKRSPRMGNAHVAGMHDLLVVSSHDHFPQTITQGPHKPRRHNNSHIHITHDISAPAAHHPAPARTAPSSTHAIQSLVVVR